MQDFCRVLAVPLATSLATSLDMWGPVLTNWHNVAYTVSEFVLRKRSDYNILLLQTALETSREKTDFADALRTAVYTVLDPHERFKAFFPDAARNPCNPFDWNRLLLPFLMNDQHFRTTETHDIVTDQQWLHVCAENYLAAPSKVVVLCLHDDRNWKTTYDFVQWLWAGQGWSHPRPVKTPWESGGSPFFNEFKPPHIILVMTKTCTAPPWFLHEMNIEWQNEQARRQQRKHATQQQEIMRQQALAQAAAGPQVRPVKTQIQSMEDLCLSQWLVEEPWDAEVKRAECTIEVDIDEDFVTVVEAALMELMELD